MIRPYGNPDQTTGQQVFGSSDATNYKIGATFPYGQYIYIIVSNPYRGYDVSNGITTTFLSFEARPVNRQQADQRADRMYLARNRHL